MALAPYDPTQRARGLLSSPLLKVDSYNDTSSLDNLDHTLSLVDIDAFPRGYLERPKYIGMVAGLHARRFQITKSVKSIDNAIKIAKSTGSPLEPSAHAQHLASLAFWYSIRFNCLGLTEDLDRTVALYREAAKAGGLDYPHPPYFRDYYESWSGVQSSSVHSIEKSGYHMKDAMDAMQIEGNDRASFLYTLAALFEGRFNNTGQLQDIDSAIDVLMQAINALPPSDNAAWGAYQDKLCSWLRSRFEKSGLIEDVSREIDARKALIDATANDHPQRSRRLYLLGFTFGKRYEMSGTIDDLKLAIRYSEEGVAGNSSDGVSRTSHLSNLGIWLGKEFEYSGSMDALNRAIDMSSMAVDTIPIDHTARPNLLKNLAILLRRRFQILGSLEDLSHGIDLVRISVAITPFNHPLRASRLSSLSIQLGTRFERTKSMEDLNLAIDSARQAIHASPNNPNRAPYLLSLSKRLTIRFREIGSIDDLNSAVEFAKSAIDITPEGHTHRVNFLKGVADALGMRYERMARVEDLTSAIEYAEMALKATAADQSTRASELNDLAQLHLKYSEHFKTAGSVDSALSLYEDSWNHANAPTADRIQAAQSAASILASQSNWAAASTLLDNAVMLLPNVFPRHLSHFDKQHMLTKFAGLACNAAAAAIQAGKGAYDVLKVLEIGRGVISSFLLDIRMDLTDLRRDIPSLADEFASLSDELDAPEIADELGTAPTDSNEASLWEARAKRRRDLDSRLSELVTRIRAQPGYQTFQASLTVEEFMYAANPDPIAVINVSSYRCDAILIREESMSLLPLPNLHLDDIQRHVRDLRQSHLAASPAYMRRLLEWMWDSIASQIIDALDFQSNPGQGDTWPRIWWIPTGLLSRLPIHSAGYHRKGSTATVIDRVVSSYSTSVKALIYGRRRRQPTISESNAVLLAMEKTPGLSSNHVLPFAKKEIQIVTDLCPALNTAPIHPNPCKKDTVSSLRSCMIFHFAGHGRADPLEPSQSALLLNDWASDPLTVSNLRELRLGNTNTGTETTTTTLPEETNLEIEPTIIPNNTAENRPKSKSKATPHFLAYLSACSTTANAADSLVDEAIHLTSAFQLAGFRHVIGTLWEVADQHSVDIARAVYETLRGEGLTDWAVAWSLHVSARALRDGSWDHRGGTRKRDAKLITTSSTSIGGEYSAGEGLEGDSFNVYWVPYVHFGV